MDRIQSIQIENFKKISNASFDLNDINLLVGSNNSGKSSVIQSIHFAISILQSALLAKNKISDSLSMNPSELLYSPSEDVYALGTDGKLFEDEDKAIKITFTLNSGKKCAISARKGKNRNIAIKIQETEIATRLAELSKPFSIFSPGLAGVAKREHYISDGVLLRTLARGDANLILRNILLRLFEDQDKWAKFLSDLQEIFPELSIEVHFENSTDEFIDVKVQFHDGPTLPLELAGTGVLQALQILSYIHNFNPSLIVLDEPDSHLHPNNQRLLCSLLNKIAEDRETQVILTTHSRHIVDALTSHSLFLWVRNGEVEPAAQEDEVGILMDIGALDVRERIASIDADVIVLTEDERTLYLKTLLESSGFNLSKTAVLPYYGCTSTKNLRPLINVIKKSNKRAKIIIHRDRDYLIPDEASEWETSIRAIQVEPFLTAGVDTESHFLNPEHLAELNPKLNAADFKQLITTIKDNIKINQIKNYVNGRLEILRKSGKHVNLDHGNLAVEANSVIASDPERWFHGKETIRAIKAAYQIQYKENLIVLKSTKYIKCDILEAYSKKIKWK